jgi:putative NADH-flavin reductase
MKIEQSQTIYNLLIVGANGGIGRQTVQLALQAGHQVTAVVRNPANLTLLHANLKVVKGDLMQPESFKNYLTGIDAVISAVGTKGGFMHDEPTVVYSRGNANLLQAMAEMKVKRVFFISASAIEISPVLPFYVRLAEKYIVQKLLRHMYDDLRRMEALVKQSDANWTIIRPPQLSDKPVTGVYRVAVNEFLKNCLKISRADVAHYMLNNIGNEATYGGLVEIGY